MTSVEIAVELRGFEGVLITLGDEAAIGNVAGTRYATAIGAGAAFKQKVTFVDGAGERFECVSERSNVGLAALDGAAFARVTADAVDVVRLSACDKDRRFAAALGVAEHGT